MNPQFIAIIVAIATLFVGLLVHAVATAWWASRLTTTVEGIGKSLTHINQEFEKRDKMIAAQWTKLDNYGNRLTALEARQ